jgi:hypothetical protein
MVKRKVTTASHAKSGIILVFLTVCPKIYAGFVGCNVLKSQLEWFFLFLIWQSEVLVYMQMFNCSLIPSLLSNLLFHHQQQQHNEMLSTEILYPFEGLSTI